MTYLDAAAYDAPGVSITKVVFELNGQVIATATPTIYGWLAQWNTTNVASGIYDLVSVALTPKPTPRPASRSKSR